MDRAITQFLQHLQTDKAFSPNTIVAYRNDLTQLLSFVQAQSNGAGPHANDWRRVDAPLVHQYYASLQSRHYAATTIARKVASVKSFFHFLVSEKLVANNPTHGFTSPGIRRALPKTVTAGEVNELIEQSAQRDTPEAKRDWAMLTLLYATGMRVTELVKLNVDDVILDSAYPYVRCLGRGTRPRLIPLSPEGVEPMHQYLNQARDRIVRRPGEQALFLNRRGERLTRQGFWLILKGYVKAANLRGDITPHMLRHTFATHMLKSGRLNLRELQEFLGHASITTTQVYTQVPDVTVGDGPGVLSGPVLTPGLPRTARKAAQAATR